MVHVFLGIIIVGIILAVKVVMDGLQTITSLNGRITVLKTSTQHCQIQTAEQETQIKEDSDQLQAIKTKVEQLAQKEKDIQTEIRGLRSALDSQSFKIDL